MGLWDLVSGEVRVSLGHPYALDLGAISTVFEKIGLEPDEIERQLKRMKVIFGVIYGPKEQQ